MTATTLGLSVLLSYWRRWPLQFFTLFFGLALSTALWCAVQAINSEARSSYDQAAQTVGQGIYPQILPRFGETMTDEHFVTLRRSGWLVSPILEGSLQIDGQRIWVIGIEPLTSPAGIGSVGLDLSKRSQDDFADFLRQKTVFASSATARILETAPGVLNDIRILQDASAPASTLIADIGLAQRLLGQDGEISRLVVAPEQTQTRPELEAIAPDLKLEPPDIFVDAGRLTDSFHLNLTAFGLLSFAVGLFIVQGAIRLAFENRRQLVRTLRTLGLSLRRVILVLALELSVIALLAGLAGIGLGYGVAGALMPDVAVTLEGLYGAQVSGGLRVRPGWALSGLAMSLAGATLAATASLVQTARLPLIASAHLQALKSASHGQRRIMLGSALALLSVTAALLVWGTGLVSGFILLGSLLIGAALLLPPLLEAALSFAQRWARAGFTEWFIADTRLALNGLNLALMALMLAMATNIGVSTMVQSFRQAFVGFLDQRLAADFYVDAETQEIAAKMIDALSPRGTTFLPILTQDTQFADRPAVIQGIRVGPTYAANWDFLESTDTPWQQIEAGEALSMNEQMARRTGLALGDSRSIAPGRSLKIAAVHGDYGNPKYQVIVSEAIFKEVFPDIEATRFGLVADDTDGTYKVLTGALGLSPSQIVDQRSIKAFSLGIFDRTFIVTGALNVLTLGVAGFAVLTSLLTAASMRMAHLAPLWAMGMTRRTLAMCELARALGVTVLTAICAIPLGLALAWVLLAVVNVDAFGWRLPMDVFPWSYLKLCALALCAAAIAALWPAWRLSRIRPAQLLQVFASAR